MIDWLVSTLQRYPELAIFLTLAIGYWVGKFKVGGFSLGAVTGTLLAGVLIGQLQIAISPNVKSVFFLMFLFAVGYGVGPQFVRGLGADGLKQMAFAVIVVVFCLISAYVAALIAGLDVGYAAGLLSGASTISAVIGVATDAINGLGLPPDQTQTLLNHIPIAYAVTYIFGTAGSAWFLASMGPKILGVDIVKECQDYEKTLSGGAGSPEPGIISAYRRFEARAYRIDPGSPMLDKPVAQLLPGIRVFVERVRRGSQIFEADGSTVLLPGDTIAMGAPIFTPYLEMPELEDYALHEVHLHGTQETRWQFSDDELNKLADPKVKAFFLVNPGNPSSVAVSPEVIAKLVKLVQKKRPDLIILTDDVYGTFVKGFRSLMADLPHNTIGVYSYSKYFGCTGWRLGVVAAHEKNILDEKIAAHDEETKKALDKRYGS